MPDRKEKSDLDASTYG